MSVSFRTTILVLAALASSSVAPAQVRSSDQEPLIASNELPRIIVPASLDTLSSDRLSGDTLSDHSPIALPQPVGRDGDNQQNANDIKSVPGESLAGMVTRLKSSSPASREQECLASAVYFESKSEPLAGQLAVGEVIANRAKSGRFASTYCGVVFQRGQFSFIRGHSMPSIPRSGAPWKAAVAIAAIVDAKLSSSTAPRALFFHAKRVSPSWHATRVAAIGNHIFYR